MRVASLLTILAAPILALATARTSPPSGALPVGAGQKYSTISAAISALSTTSTSHQTIFIYPGTYQEQVYIPALKGPLTIYGSTSDTSDYTHNAVTITHSLDATAAGNDDKSGTLRVWSQNVAVYNVNVVNTYGKGSQAIALSAYAGQQGYYGCSFKGYQDTVLAETGAQVYAKSYVEGAVDFIFGQTALAWFDGCTISSIGSGCVTASGRNDSSNPSWYVINKSSINGGSGSGTGTGSTAAVTYEIAGLTYEKCRYSRERVRG